MRGSVVLHPVHTRRKGPALIFRTLGLRYLEWTWDPDPGDTTYLTDYAYLLRTPDGTVRVEHDRHVGGLFARADWLRLFAEAGFEARAVPFDHSEVDYPSEVFVAKRPRE